MLIITNTTFNLLLEDMINMLEFMTKIELRHHIFLRNLLLLQFTRTEYMPLNLWMTQSYCLLGGIKRFLFGILEQKKSVDFIFGPEICGDSLDYYDNKILTGSFRDNKQIQLFDLRNLKNM